MKASHKVFLSLGCNLGDRQNTLDLAVKYLVDCGLLYDCKVSSYYETEPFGVPDQPWFLNIAVQGDTYYSPELMLYMAKSLEYLLGRKPRARWHEREIDIDLVFYDELCIDSEKLILPHKMMHLRNFVLAPMAELAPDLVHPVLKKNMLELLDDCEDNCKIKKVDFNGASDTK